MNFLAQLFSLVLLAAFATSCTIKDSVFDSEVRTAYRWNDKFTVPHYNLAGGDVVKFAVITDTHQNYADLSDTVKRINNSGAQFVIHTGDFTNFGSGDEYELFIEYIKKLNVPIYVLPGNHDITTHGKKLYPNVFGDENRAIATDFGKLIFWNNNKLESKFIDHDFLTNEFVTADPAKPVFLFHHQDPYNALTFSDSDNIQYTTIVQSHPKPIVIHGHLHRFYTQTLNGIPFFQISRTEGSNWAMVEIDNSNVRIYYCHEKYCTLESTL